MTFPLYIATANPGKLKEIAELAREYFGDIFYPIEGRAAQRADETEPSFIGNAQIKALGLERELSDQHSYAILSDDSGLCIDLLGGRPGVHSARYAGDHVDSDQHIDKVLHDLSQIPAAQSFEARRAHYACALTLVLKNGSRRFQWNVEGQCHGLIDFKRSGNSGFGYDPIFWVPEHKKSFGEIPFDIKNQISHRRRAFEQLKTEAGPYLWASKP